MSGGWAGSDRRAELPSDWPAIRVRVFRRDGYRCTAMTPQGRCTNIATECDHVGDKLDHSVDNLASLCSYHHGRKSSRQGNDARAARRAAALRPPKAHPRDIR